MQKLWEWPSLASIITRSQIVLVAGCMHACTVHKPEMEKTWIQYVVLGIMIALVWALLILPIVFYHIPLSALVSPT